MSNNEVLAAFTRGHVSAFRAAKDGAKGIAETWRRQAIELSDSVTAYRGPDSAMSSVAAMRAMARVDTLRECAEAISPRCNTCGGWGAVATTVRDQQGECVEQECPECTPLHRLRDGTTGTTLEALAEAQREVEARDAPPITRADYLARLAAMTLAHSEANDNAVIGLYAEFPEGDDPAEKWPAFDFDGERMRENVPGVTAIVHENFDLKRRVESLEREKAALERQVELWCHDADVARDELRDTKEALQAGLSDALDALSLMTGFVEAAHYAEKYGVPETMARLRKLLPESAVAPEKHGRTEEVEWRHYDMMEHARIGRWSLEVWPDGKAWCWCVADADEEEMTGDSGSCATEDEAKAAAIKAARGGK